MLPGLLVRFAEVHPNVRLSVRTGHSEEIVELAVRDEIGVGLVRAIRHPLLAQTTLYEDELVLVVEPGHPFAASGTVGIERVAEATTT